MELLNFFFVLLKTWVYMTAQIVLPSAFVLTYACSIFEKILRDCHQIEKIHSFSSVKHWII